jgi:hypothetical protein
MQQHLIAEILQFLRSLEATQEELAALFDRKRAALCAAQPQELIRLASVETELTERLQKLLLRRGRILQQAHKAGLASSSLETLLAQLDDNQTRELQPTVARARRRSHDLRRESWVQWVITHRACSHYSGLLEIIANCGEKQPTYSRNQRTDVQGGAILDASA